MSAKFSERFDVGIDSSEARRRFVNRIANSIFGSLFESELIGERAQEAIQRAIASVIGEKYDELQSMDALLNDDFYNHLQATETFYELASSHPKSEELQRKIDGFVEWALAESEVDLSVEWRDGAFLRKGAKIFDDELVNKPLQWMQGSAYDAIRTPFEKALRHLLQSEKRSELGSDAITDAYESLEALAKLITGRDKDLSANCELFLSKLGVSVELKPILKSYIEFANVYRHAGKEAKKKPIPSIPEAEWFIYLTGAFIRLALSSRGDPAGTPRTAQ